MVPTQGLAPPAAQRVAGGRKPSFSTCDWGTRQVRNVALHAGPDSLLPAQTHAWHPLRVETLQTALTRFIVGSLPSDDLPDIAAHALASGLDSPSLRSLAGASRAEPREARDLFLAAVSELGFRIPSETEARRALVRLWAHQMIDGTLTPCEGSRLIWWEGWEELGRPDDLTVFVSLASQWEDSPAYRADLERDMLAAAESLVEGS